MERGGSGADDDRARVLRRNSGSPQGTVYDYQCVMVASNRDQAQHALHYEAHVPDGEIKLDDLGYGWAPHSGRLTSDQQRYFLVLLNEYLRATGDASSSTRPDGVQRSRRRGFN